MGLDVKRPCAHCGSRSRLVAALAALAAWSVVGAAPAPPLTAEQPTDFGPEDASLFLHMHGYLNDSIFNASSMQEESFKEALTSYQLFSSLPITGTLDAATKRMMQVPRFGAKDINPQGDGTRQKRHALLGTKFSKRLVLYRLHNSPPRGSQLTRSQAEKVLKRAGSMWSSESGLISLAAAPRGLAANIDVSFQRRNHGSCDSFDGPGGVLAHAIAPKSGKAFIHFDADEKWVAGNRGVGTNFFQVAVHELGHALGLDHSSSPQAVMAAFHQNKYNFKLHSDDIRGIQALYGLKKVYKDDLEVLRDMLNEFFKTR